MRSVTGTAPGMLVPSAFAAAEALSPGVLCAYAGAHAAMTAAAAVSPVVRRNARRVGFDGLDDGLSRIEPPFGCSDRGHCIPNWVSQAFSQEITSERGRPPRTAAKSLCLGVGMPRTALRLPFHRHALVEHVDEEIAGEEAFAPFLIERPRWFGGHHL